jgi:tRNA dimethylallyltransferase
MRWCQAVTAAADAAGVTPEQLDPAARWAAATALVAQLGDPDSAARVAAERNNWYRLQRVLQVLLQNGGRPLAEHDIDTTRPLDYDFRCFFLHAPRIPLYDRISDRVEEMVRQGRLRAVLAGSRAKLTDACGADNGLQPPTVEGK